MKMLASIPARSVPGLSAVLQRRRRRRAQLSAAPTTNLISMTAVSFGPEGTHFAAVLTMRESVPTARGDREVTRVVRLNGQVDPAAAEEAILAGHGRSSGASSPVMMVESFLRVLQSDGSDSASIQIPGVCFDQQPAASTAVSSSVCVAAHLGVVDGGRDPNMEPSLKLMLLVRNNSGDGAAADPDETPDHTPFQTLVVHMNRYNEAPDLCRLERSSDATSPFTVDASDLDHMDGIDDDEEEDGDADGDADRESLSHGSTVPGGGDRHHFARSRGRAGQQYAALEAHWVSRLLLPGRFSPSIIRRAVSVLDTGVQIRRGASPTAQADFVDASSATTSAASIGTTLTAAGTSSSTATSSLSHTLLSVFEPATAILQSHLILLTKVEAEIDSL